MAQPKNTAVAPEPHLAVDADLTEVLAENEDLKSDNEMLKARLAAIDAELAALRAKPKAPEPNQPRLNEDGDPIFNEEEPYGLVVGDSDVAYVQGGHQFGRNKQYLRDEPRGSPKAFNPKLVGVVKPRVVQAA